MNGMVSVIVPCYNQAQYLDECLQSVLKQSYDKWECIIVNDGGTDDAYEVASKWCKLDDRFKYIFKENGGLSSARNAGISISKGEYILPLDADDCIASTFLIKAINLLLSDNNIKAVSSYVSFFGIVSGLFKTRGGSINEFLNSNTIVASSLYYKSEFIRIGNYDENMKDGYEDWEFWIRLLANGGKIEIIKEPLFFYRKKNESMLVSSYKKHLTIYEYIINKHYGLFNIYFSDIIIKKENALLDLHIKNDRLRNNLRYYIYVKSRDLFKRIINKLKRFSFNFIL
jgi:glycosyltransferase involved in cell wall biosynthesis